MRASAAVALGKAGREVGEAVRALVRALGDAEVVVRFAAVQALEGFRPMAKEAVPGLIQALRDANASVHQGAVKTLGSIGPEAKGAVPELRKPADNDQLKPLRPLVMETLGKMEQR